MGDILIKAIGFVLVMLLGYLLRIKGVVSKSDAKIFSTIVMNVTLPCALLLSASSLRLTSGLAWPLLLGLGMNLVMDGVGYLSGRAKDKVGQSASVVQISGYNIGTFSLPFVQAFFPANHLLSVLLFDAGNAVMVLGGNYLVGAQVTKKAPMKPLDIVRNLFGSVPFMVYLVAFGLTAVGVTIPSGILSIAAIAGQANPFLAMLMLGILIDFRLEKREWGRLFFLLALRIGVSSLASLLIYFFFPLPLVVRQMLVLCIFSPISVVAPVYALKLGSKTSEAANLNSLTIIATLPIMIVLVLMFAG